MRELITINGRSQTKAAWAREIGISLTGFCQRLRNNWSDDELLRSPRETKEYESHGMKGTPLYRAWGNMRNRCYNEKHRFYSHYGARGIKVCDEWNGSFKSFYEWAIDNGYQKGLSIDRIDNDGNYEPSNCRWATTQEQNINKRTNVYVEIDGVTKTLSEWATEVGIRQETIYRRYYVGWRGEDLISKTQDRSVFITIDGTTKKLSEWANESGIERSTIMYRFKNGIEGKELLKPTSKGEA